MRLLKQIVCTALVVSASIPLWSFCGFYVARADASLFNNRSEVIIVRDGNNSVITMKSDFQGELKEFAMVVPVPQVLRRDQIRTLDPSIIKKLDDYSAPRMAKYYDPKPCQPPQRVWANSAGAVQLKSMAVQEFSSSRMRKEDYKVTIEAKYAVDEYDILILSAKESDGLKRWLNDNDYKIPAKAEEVLEPYIKNKMKFFVVKVNLDRKKDKNSKELSPLQLAFKSEKFMLPIRLGMANANGDQDMIVHVFTKNGRTETSNYRTVKIPSDNEIPTFVSTKFGEFYKDAFNVAWKKENEKAVMLEYAWDISSTNPVKCDPCPAPVMAYKDLREMGVYWVTPVANNMARGAYVGKLFVTRLHVRYNRKNYPQDLQFVETPNKERFQGRYVIRYAAGTNFSCDAARPYYKGVVTRRTKELDELASLTGWDVSKHKDYVDEYAKVAKKPANGWIEVNDFSFLPTNPFSGPNGGKWAMALGLLLGTAAVYGLSKRRNA